MKFEEYIENHFFVITSDNYKSFPKSRLYGYCIVNNSFMRDCLIPSGVDLTMDTPGFFTAILKEEGGLRIIQDTVSFQQLYLYQNEKYWAVSNSFWTLCDEVKQKFKLTLDEVYCEQFFSSGVSPLTINRTLAKEIKLISPRTELVINEGICFERKMETLLNKAPIDSKEAMDSMDRWIRRWTSIIRGIFNAGYRIKIDLSGGFDSRVSLALVLVSGIDLNSEQVTIYSRGPSEVYGDEDWRIASEIARQFNFKLSKSYDAFGAERISGKDRFDINRLTMSNCHREPYFPGAFYEKPVFYINGLGGENIRGWKQRDAFLGFFKNPVGRTSKHYFPVIAQRELIRDWSALPVFNKNEEINEKERNRYYMMAVRNRNHFGVVASQNYILNYIQVVNFSDIDILRVGITEGLDTTSVFAVILSRTCPELLEIPVEGGRSFSQEGIELANKLKALYPPDINTNSEEISFPESMERLDIEVGSAAGESAELILDHLFDEVYREGLFQQRFGEYGRILIEDAKKNRNDKSIPFPRQYESVIVAVARMLKIEEESKGGDNKSAKTTERFSGNNRLLEDEQILEELVKKVPDLDILKNEYEQMRYMNQVGGLKSFREDMSMDEMLEMLDRETAFVRAYPKNNVLSAASIHDSFRNVMVSDCFNSLSLVKKRRVVRDIRKMANQLPDKTVLTNNSISMTLFVNHGIVAFEMVNRIKRILKKRNSSK